MIPACRMNSRNRFGLALLVEMDEVFTVKDASKIEGWIQNE